jgi:lysophospholipase L1-like esterase
MNKRLSALCAITALLAACAHTEPQNVPLDYHVGGVTREVVANGHPVHEYQWPGVYFEARFDGPAVSFSVDDDQNVLYVLVDGELQLVLPRAGYRDVTLADLGDGAHTIRIEKTSETQGSTARFLGFSVPDADRRLAPPAYTRAIEFIGDSFTVGYGDTSTGTECSGTQVRDTTNTSLAFGPLTAKHFAADYRILASSGFGMVRNYANKEPGTTMPVLYHRALSGEPVAAWQPDAIVIWLGTNDFSTALGEDERWQDPARLRDDYRASYVRFVEALQQASPKAHVVLIASGAFVDDVNDVRSRLDGDVTVLRVDGLTYQGCHGHPSVEDHGEVARRLIALLAKFPSFGN